jgi:hypothetical protein
MLDEVATTAEQSRFSTMQHNTRTCATTTIRTLSTNLHHNFAENQGDLKHPFVAPYNSIITRIQEWIAGTIRFEPSGTPPPAKGLEI